MKDKVKSSVKLYRKDPCPINYNNLLNEAMWYIFVGWCFWLTASVVDGWMLS